MITWDGTFEAAPGDGDNIEAGAGEIRDLKLAISEREEIEHTFKSDGKHRPGKCSILYYGTTTEINALTGMPQYAIAWDTTLKVLKYYTGSAWVVVDIDHGALSGKSDDDHTQYLHLDKEGQTLLHSLTVEALMTIDGRDISVDGATLDALVGTVTGGYNHYACFVDHQDSGTNGGTFTLGSWATRTLNTTVKNEITGVVLAANRITLPAGNYRVRASAPAYWVNEHQIRLYDITNSALLLLGSTEYAVTTQTRSFLEGSITTAGANVELQHICGTTRATYGLGKAGSLGSGERYSSIELWSSL